MPCKESLLCELSLASATFHGNKIAPYGQNMSAIVALDQNTHTERARVASAIEDFVAAGCWCPVEIVIARPFIEHLMMSAILTVSGRDTGAMLFGPSDM